MSKKKGKKNIIQDFTLYDCANARKAIKTIRKSAPEPTIEAAWDEIQDEVDIIEDTAPGDVIRIIVNQIGPEDIPIHERPGKVYPEIIFYLISKYIKPEDIGSFARINKAANSAMKNKAFWLQIYKRHCEHHPRLPKTLRSDNFEVIGLRETVIQALFHTYEVFVQRLAKELLQKNSPHYCVSRNCFDVWITDTPTYWSVCMSSDIRRRMPNCRDVK